ncbi:hypothetical protein C0Q70_01757 [Pomacea canaliculata]|uniref:Uncharacterized protein n=1 Tax=Pomacea canaliculata TaxID=400727 RepID=A0A2T7Q0D7_POMCA|nr:uncharacterized protein LOC112569244 [Pomacea canaliculata]XP_025102772.1 uncharacterized protein LOC112569244 [Pomacea canaliculata]XP_025102779.1 uncharacterized protein LOC112569244 [Pomacea canaliculata]PVD39129.1 hypothetical protein C0Q70_01757 [Pomacea canaliculata]
MEAEDERSGLHRMGSMAVTLAIVPLVVGFATEHWLEADMRSVGLWKFCNDVACRPLQSDDVPDWYNVVRALAVMGLCLHLVSVVTGFCCTVLGGHELFTLSIVRRLEEMSAVIAAGLIGACLGVFMQSSGEHPVFKTFVFGWSFWSCVTAICLLAPSSVVIALARDDCVWWRHCERRKTVEKHKMSLSTEVESMCSASLTMKSPAAGDNRGYVSLPKQNFLHELKSSDGVKWFHSLESISCQSSPTENLIRKDASLV